MQFNFLEIKQFPPQSEHQRLFQCNLLKLGGPPFFFSRSTEHSEVSLKTLKAGIYLFKNSPPVLPASYFAVACCIYYTVGGNRVGLDWQNGYFHSLSLSFYIWVCPLFVFFSFSLFSHWFLSKNDSLQLSKSTSSSSRNTFFPIPKSLFKYFYYSTEICSLLYVNVTLPTLRSQRLLSVKCKYFRVVTPEPQCLVCFS